MRFSERGNHEDLSSEKLYKLPLGYGDYENILFFYLAVVMVSYSRIIG